MIAYNVTSGDLFFTAEGVGVTLNNLRSKGRSIEFTLGLVGEKWRRRNHMGRRVAAVCWHGHRAFMEALFNLAPNARLKSTMIDYRGRIDFWARHDATGDRNIGSIAQPMAYRDACDCPIEEA